MTFLYSILLEIRQSFYRQSFQLQKFPLPLLFPCKLKQISKPYCILELQWENSLLANQQKLHRFKWRIRGDLLGVALKIWDPKQQCLHNNASDAIRKNIGNCHAHYTVCCKQEQVTMFEKNLIPSLRIFHTEVNKYPLHISLTSWSNITCLIIVQPSAGIRIHRKCCHWFRHTSW